MKRRDFVKSGTLATTGILVGNTVLGQFNEGLLDQDLEKLYVGFKNPPVESRLFVRWWWNGNRLSKEEILRELDVLKNAGIGGVEINPIAFPGDTDGLNYKPLTIFEDDWLNMLQVALEGAKKRGMICDMIVGSGWPFGGEFLNKQEQSQMVTIETIDIDEGGIHQFNISEILERVNPDLHSKNKNVYKDLIMARLVPKSVDAFTKGEDVSSFVKDGILEIEVPPGKFCLYFVVKLTGYMAVINGAPGAAGPVLNHYSKEAVDAYLNRISNRIVSKIGDMGTYIRAMFCDSMELEGANWNDDLPSEFKNRRGYEVKPYLPFILKKVGHMGNPIEEDYGTIFPQDVIEKLKRVELDYYKTRIELFKERFIDSFNAWCHENNVKSRMQAYGRGMHPLEASMEIDIPECETWLGKAVGRDYPNLGLEGRAHKMCNKYVASGALLSGKRIISCEEITNTEMAFMATLENIKIAGDQSNISGVNHSILHGFNYSPLEAEFPGWVRYGTFFNERNTWWPYFNKWSDYKARISFMLQNITPRANIAILQPLTDLWLKMGPQRDPFPQKWYPNYQNNLWEVINHNGGGCDYVSENIIKNSSLKNGRMTYGNRAYSILLLPEIETLAVDTAEQLVKFAQSGGVIVFIGKKPYKSAAYNNSKSNDLKVEKIINSLIDRQSERAIRYKSPEGNLIEWYGELQKQLNLPSYITFGKTDEYLTQASYVFGKTPIFFLCNTSLFKSIDVDAEFRIEDGLYPWAWNAETGERFQIPSKEGSKRLLFTIPKATSYLIVFSKMGEGEKLDLNIAEGYSFELNEKWNLQLNHMNGTHEKLELFELTDLSKIKQTENFAGQVIYRTQFQNNNLDLEYIDLGNVQGVSELRLNDVEVGSRWYGDHTYPIKGQLKKGINTISIKLTTITGNYLKGLKDNPVAQNWTRHQEYYPMGILGPIRFK